MTILDAKSSQPFSGRPSFSLANRIERVAWQFAWLLLARWTPAMFSPWRIWLLKRFGAQVGAGAAIAASTRVWLPRHLSLGSRAALGPHVDCYCMAPIHVGERTVVSQRAHLCAGSHDIRDPHFQLIARPISIGDDVWIAAEAFVAPGVKVGDGAVLAARGCAFSDLEAWTIYRGNPALALRPREWHEAAAAPVPGEAARSGR